MRRTLFIGDVHGCRQELEDLLDACAHVPDDRVIFVGDLVAKGPDSSGVLQRMRKLGAESVRGNHDHAVLRWHQALASNSAPARGNHHLQVARSLSRQDWEVLLALPLFLRVPEHNAIVVHGGIVPGIALEEQVPDMLMNMRTLRPDGTGSRRPDEGPLWGSRWPGPELVIFGHHALAGLQRHTHAIGLDTGCVYGHSLTAYLLPDDRLVSVPARSTQAAVDSERRGPV
jgi:predicted phosphodiesterase